MNLIKIGKFIAKKRKEKNLTQVQLAEILNVTDRAISKRECGRSMPDSSIMLQLSETLDISVNELLSGEELKMNNYDNQADITLIEITKEKEESDKRLLKGEIIFGIGGTILFIILLLTGVYLLNEYSSLLWLGITFIVVGIVEFSVAIFFALRIEQKAGYYECKECGHKYKPTYGQVLFALHVNRTRYMKCPHCKKRSRNKKVISDK